MSGGKIPLPALRAPTASTSPSRPGSTCAAACASSTRSRSTRRSATSATTTPTTCARSWRPSFGFHSGEGRVTRDELHEARRRRSTSRSPRRRSSASQFKDKADKSKIDDRFNKAFLGELTETPGPGDDEVTFKIRSDVESQIRDRAVAQAKDTVSRRVDELGLREAAVTTRDEDIIVEVPGSDEASFASIKEIIRKTARLEFKMVDDGGSEKVFGAAQGRQLPAGRGDRRVPGGRARRARLERPQEAGQGVLRAHLVPAAEVRDRVDDASASARFKAWASTLSVPDDHVIGFEAVTEPVADTEPLQFKQVGWRTLYLFARAEVTGDYITDASIGQDQQNFGQYYVEPDVQPGRRRPLRGGHRRERQPPLRDHPRRHRRLGARSSARRSAAAARTITMGAGDPEKQLHDAKQLELVLRSGALPAPITPSSESVIGPSLGRDAIQRGA